MKYLFVGDVHNHKYMFDDVQRLDKDYNFDKIIFFGDYVDDWLTDNHQSLETLEAVFKLKENNPEKYILLIGNHELSYLGSICSGHQYELEDLMEMKLKENLDKLDLATSVNCNNVIYICSHAGFTNAFIQKLLKDDTDYTETSLYYKMIELNKNKLANIGLLSACSSLRGGLSDFSSFLWADKREHKYFTLEKPLIPHQIVGHTPVKSIEQENGITFIDTHSTYQDGTEYGDKSYLIWDGLTFIVRY